jgi:DNA-binding SARP family transcriptional activator
MAITVSARYGHSHVNTIAIQTNSNSPFPASTPLVILHPSVANQHQFLPLVLNQPSRSPLFFSLQNPNTQLSTTWEIFSTALSEQTQHVAPPLEAPTTPEEAARIALKALAPVQPYTLVIDALDLAVPAVEAWIAALARHVPQNSQIVVGTRRLPSTLIRADLPSQRVRLFPIGPDRMLLDYTQQAANAKLLEVYGFGPGKVLTNGQPIEHWAGGPLSRALFFYFVDRGLVTRDEIFATFWPRLSMHEATNVFHVTKRKVSEALGFDLMVYSAGFYRLAPDVELHYDVVKFNEHVQNSAVADDEATVSLLHKAIDLYPSEFLRTLDLAWVKTRRTELNQVYAEALCNLAKIHQRQDRPHDALGLLLRVRAGQPRREDLVRSIMVLFSELGQDDKALAVYDRLAGELKSSLDPDPQTTQLAARIRSRA